jgi:TPP-dependent trihydroxycyclohexane-1,2-dione (THcHDO) dehydratase
VPVDGESLAVKVSVEDTLPPVGTVRGEGRLMVTPVGAVPTQAAVRVTEELNPLREVSCRFVDFETSGVRVITAGEG